MQYGIPLCMKSCIYFKKAPQFIGGKASCDKYRSIPDKIYFRAGGCVHYKTNIGGKENGGRKK